MKCPSCPCSQCRGLWLDHGVFDKRIGHSAGPVYSMPNPGSGTWIASSKAAGVVAWREFRLKEL